MTGLLLSCLLNDVMYHSSLKLKVKKNTSLTQSRGCISRLLGIPFAYKVRHVLQWRFSLRELCLNVVNNYLFNALWFLFTHSSFRDSNAYEKLRDWIGEAYSERQVLLRTQNDQITLPRCPLYYCQSSISINLPAVLIPSLSGCFLPC